MAKISGRKHLWNKVFTSWIFLSKPFQNICLEIKCLIIPLLFANFIQREALIFSTFLPRWWRIYVNDLYHIRNIHLKNRILHTISKHFNTVLWTCSALKEYFLNKCTESYLLHRFLSTLNFRGLLLLCWDDLLNQKWVFANIFQFQRKVFHKLFTHCCSQLESRQ